MPQPNLSGRAALVTGAAGQLGRHIVACLRDCGARVVAVDRPGPALSALESQDIVTLGCDLRDDDATAACIAQAWAVAGPISILVNTAGRIDSAPLVNIAAREGRRLSAASWRDTIE